MAAKLLSIFLLFFLQRLAVAKDFSILGYAPEDLESEEKLAVLYAAWQQKHGKFNEDSKRFEIFKDNLKFIHEENQKNENYFLALNQFADLTHEEFKATRFGLHKERPNRLKSSSNFKYAGVKDIPDSVDWREKGAVVAVKDQGSCGSCWAFSTVAVVEGINAIVTGDLYSLSEQELIDCDKKEDDGCNGGLMDYAMEWIIENGGIDSEEDYPYKGLDGRCDANKKNAKLVTIDGYEDVPAYDEDALLKAVANQPVAVAIDGGSRSFQYYAGGVFTGTCSETELNHGVTVVGYGTEGGVGYWIVRNSWGPSWGEKGYVRMKRGAGLKAGLCGILTEPSYPVKNGANPPNPGPTPPAPTPPETVCDEYYTCQEDTTCCCIFPWNNLCFAWGCCPLKSATCCDDHYHCCPEDFPICNTSANTCLKGQNDLFGTRMMKRTPALPLKAAQSKKAARH